jgi:hypothetical protein
MTADPLAAPSTYATPVTASAPSHYVFCRDEVASVQTRTGYSKTRIISRGLLALSLTQQHRSHHQPCLYFAAVSLHTSSRSQSNVAPITLFQNTCPWLHAEKNVKTRNALDRGDESTEIETALEKCFWAYNRSNFVISWTQFSFQGKFRYLICGM